MVIGEDPVPTSEFDWEALIEDWIAYSSEDGLTDSDPRWWAISAVIMLPINKNHRELWEFITRTFERAMSEKAFGALAAGPLEDLIGLFGELYIDRVEEMARKSPRFNHLLGGVWHLLSSKDVWARVEKARLREW